MLPVVPDGVTGVINVALAVLGSTLFFILLFKIKDLTCCQLYVLNRLVVCLRLQRQGRIKTVPDLKRTDLTPMEIGLVPSAIEYELEYPCNSAATHSDGIHFVGMDSNNNLIDVCIDRICEEMALVWAVLKLADGTVYTLPSGDCRRPYIADESLFSSSGLQIKCLSPLRRWRISFNGLLRKQDSEGKEEEDELVHTKFSFVWLAMSAPQEQKLSYNGRDLAGAFTTSNRAIGEKDLAWLQTVQDRYEQWGQLMGTIAFRGEEAKEFYFWSIRTRILDSPLWDQQMCSAKFYMYFPDGVPLKVETVTIENFVWNLTSGFTVKPTGAVAYISQCDFRTHLLQDNDKNVEFSFMLNQKLRTAHVTFSEVAATLLTGYDLQRKVNLMPFKVKVHGFDDGYGMLHFTRSNTERGKPFRHPPLLLKDPGYTACEELVLLLEDEACRSSSISGGKGSSLALLTKLSKLTSQFVVPKGFVVTTKAFEDHIRSNKHVSDAILKLKDVSCRKLPGDLKKECDKCTEIFMSSELSEQLKNDIKCALLDNYEFPKDVRFSVRSSAFGEDSEDLSAAGQMLTILGVKGIDKIFRAVIECWSSKFGFEAVQYARQNGQPIMSPMAVVVQEMVPSDFSGVLFTVDPVTGDPSYPYISANFGLGETVVSALADPDTVILKRGRDQSLQVFQVSVGAKKTQVFMTAGDGVERKDYEIHSQRACLSNECAINIGKAGILIESCFCSPRDIEWAVHKEQLYLLQARPITTLHTDTDFELMHDQDTPTRSICDYWTRANTGEVFLGATSPLGISLVVGGMDIYNHKVQVVREGCPNDYTPYYLHILPVTHRQICLNVIDTLLKVNGKEITSLQRAFEVGLFGRPVITEEIRQAGIKKYGYSSLKHKLAVFIFIPRVVVRFWITVTRLDKALSEYRLPMEQYNSARKTLDGIMRQMNFYSEMCAVHGMTSILSSFSNVMLLNILLKSNKDWDTELYCDFATLLSSCTGVESADVPASLKELAISIANEYGDTFSSLSVSDAYDWLRNESGKSGQLFENFLRQHGHRCVKEFDVYSKSWGMQPDSIIPTLQNMVKVATTYSDVAPKEMLTTEAVLAKIKTPLNSIKKYGYSLS